MKQGHATIFTLLAHPQKTNEGDHVAALVFLDICKNLVRADVAENVGENVTDCRAKQGQNDDDDDGYQDEDQSVFY